MRRADNRGAEGAEGAEGACVSDPHHIELLVVKGVVRLEDQVDAEVALHFVEDRIERVVDGRVDAHDDVLSLVQVAQFHELAPDFQ